MKIRHAAQEGLSAALGSGWQLGTAGEPAWNQRRAGQRVPNGPLSYLLPQWLNFTVIFLGWFSLLKMTKPKDLFFY